MKSATKHTPALILLKNEKQRTHTYGREASMANSNETANNISDKERREKESVLMSTNVVLVQEVKPTFE
jgi:hypothetical protein